ncbi:MAG: hypothetical protein ACJ8FY_26145 [Gemmataceae bacterium]
MLMVNDGWELLCAGKNEAALKRFQKEFERHPSPGFIGNMGIAYLCMEDPLAAKGKFYEALKMYSSGCIEDFAGVAHWLLNERAEAIAMWEKGLTGAFHDGAGGMDYPLLLLYASIRAPDLFSLRAAKDLVHKATKHPWASNWPGPIGLYMLGKIDKHQLKSEAVFEVESVTHEQLTQAEFYMGINGLIEGKDHDFREHIKRCANAKRCEGLTEFHLARHEISQLAAKRDRKT